MNRWTNVREKILSLRILGLLPWVVTLPTACTTLPDPQHKSYSFPTESAFFGNVTRPYKKLGMVRSKVDYPSLDSSREEDDLCRNYFNKAVRDLVKMARDQGADAVIDVKSVVYLEDGRQEVYTTPECSDDGMEGQILTQGIAIQWVQKFTKKGG